MMQSVGTTWANVPPAQRRWGLMATAIVVAGLIALTMVGRQGQWGVLYSNLTPDGASKVITALTAHHIPFRPSEDGTSILVPPDRLAAVRIQLAGEGLPTGIVGFGLFDHLPLGASDAVERVDYMRALEGQLTEAVQALAEVRSAQVMLAMPETSTYTSDDRPARAAVMVSLQPGAQLSASEVKAITHLVASGVQGLAPDRVSVVDDHGQLLAAGNGQADGALSGSDLESLQRSTEQRVHDQIAALVDAVAGPGRSVIEVRAEMRAAQVQTVEEAPSQGVPVSQQSVQETYTGGPAPVPGGGTQSATTGTVKPPVYGAPAAGGAAAASQYQRQQQTTNFQEGRKRVETKEPGGQLDRLAVTVFVDNSVGLTTANNIQQSITTGFLNAKRGDTLVLTRVPFVQQAPGTVAGIAGRPGGKAAAAGPSLVMVGAAGAVGGALLAAAVLLVLRRGKKAPVPVAPVVPAPVAPVVPPPTDVQDDELSQQVAEWARRNPAVSADVVRAWWGNSGAESNG